MSAVATKRIGSEFREMVRNRLDKEGIYIWYDDDNIMEIYALIIGPLDTCYQGGFYFFKLVVPNDYPFSPPTVTFLTQTPGNSRIRMHPNLCADGKVCLTMINTYVGPTLPDHLSLKWSPTGTIRTVLLTIQSIMDDHPLRNEPGYEGYPNDDSRLQNYNRVIEYWNVRSAVIYWTRTIRTGQGDKLVHFADLVESHFLQHYDECLGQVTHLKEKYQGQFVSTNYNINCTLDYEKLEQELLELHQKLAPALSGAQSGTNFVSMTISGENDD